MYTTKKLPSTNMAPGSLRVPEGAVCPTVLQAIRYTPETCEEQEFASVAEAVAWQAGKGVLWLNINGLGNADFLLGMNTELGFHPLALEDTLSVPQRPKADEYEGHLCAVVRMFHYDGKLEREQLSILLGENVLVTIQEREGDCLDTVRHRLREGSGQVRSRPAGYLLYALLDAVVDSYFPLLEEAGERIEDLQELAMLDASETTLGCIHQMRRDLLELRRAVWPLRDALGALLRSESAFFADETRVYLRDCYDHAVQVLDITETYRELAGSLMDIYLSSLSNRMNEVMKVLTIIATIFIPLTFIAGIYGMNFENMPELHWAWGYPAVWGLMLVTTAVMVVYFRRKGWLGGNSPSKKGEPPSRQR
ncbi:MAG: magnesium/cobalt transporter CorA [Victivallales bacterium]|nr:magnesium/cobalt transporter CorA [Victivallales bacterium]MBT7299125.1 magnesium/cobalt transporter CorA [Victivallales bacterium]